MWISCAAPAGCPPAAAIWRPAQWRRATFDPLRKPAQQAKDQDWER
jgi:hypothetical protein